MGPSGIVGQSRSVGEPRSLFCFAGYCDGSSSTDLACDSFQRRTSNRGPRRTASPACSGKAWLEERESYHPDHLYGERAKRLLGRTWILPLRRNLMPFNLQDGLFADTLCGLLG